MDELFLKMHEEAMDLQEAVTELRCMIDDLSDAIEEREVEIAQRGYSDKREYVEDASIKCSKIKRIIGMNQNITKKAEAILRAREEEAKNEE